MYEYEIMFITTGEITLIYGYNFDDACMRSNIDPACVECLMFSYVD